MGQVLELGRRVALQPMDAYCHDITIGLYLDTTPDGRPVYILHSYSRHPDAGPRLAFLAAAACHLGGLVPVAGRPLASAWPCGASHLAATRRLFVEICKLGGPDMPHPRPLAMPEAKSSATFRLAGLGDGAYRLSAEAPGDPTQRLQLIAGGFVKMAGMTPDDGEGLLLRLPCGIDHDALVGLLLPRALNARAALREEEAAKSRGVLAAPSAQAQTP